MGSRFSAPAIAGTPRRRCPRHWMFLAAFSSRSRIRPQLVQTWVRTESDFCMRSPHLLQSWLVYAGLTASTRFPAHAAVKVSMDRKRPHPASCRLLLRLALRAAPFCSYPPFPSGSGAGRRLRLAGWMAS